jgi:hypothetical protein
MIVNGQSISQFAAGEGQRVYNLLDTMGCIGNPLCDLRDFTPTSVCNGSLTALKCDGSGATIYL